MTLEQYWSAFLKRWKLIILCIAIVGLGAYIGSKLMTPEYQSTTLIEVNILSSNNQTDINTTDSTGTPANTKANWYSHKSDSHTTSKEGKRCADRYPGSSTECFTAAV